MNIAEQGVLQRSRVIYLLVQFLLPIIFGLTTAASAEAQDTAEQLSERYTKKHHVFFIYSQDNTLHENIIQTLSDKLSRKSPDIVTSKLSLQEKIKTIDNDSEIIIAIGSAGMQIAKNNYPKTNKLFISTDPDKYRLDKNSRKDDAILYMTQSYCRQIKFIKSLNDQWKVIGLLNSREKPVDNKRLQQCAKRHGINTYTVKTSTGRNISADLKNALKHSDILLALPDKNIYNSRTVKNILLTSYRHRKPVIAFSRNFVNAGALASIHSNTEQIAQSASLIIEQYFKRGGQFDKSVYYPQLFDIDINRQVFRALDLSLPNINKIKQTLQNQDQDALGELR